MIVVFLEGRKVNACGTLALTINLQQLAHRRLRAQLKSWLPSGIRLT